MATGRSSSPIEGGDFMSALVDESGTQVDFSQMPQEILVIIFSYIDADYLLKVVSYVCKRLQDVLFGDQYWKLRLFNRYPKHFPIVHDLKFSMPESGRECLACWKTWKMSDALSKKIILSKPTGSAVDCVHMTKDRNLCITGSRDHSIGVWKLNPEPGSNNDVPTSKLFVKQFIGHRAWIWSIKSRNDEICSASFDSTVKFWDSSTLQMTQDMGTRAAVICSSYVDDHTLAVGCFNKKTKILDKRSNSIQRELTNHKSSVLKIQVEDNYIVTAGEDGFLAVTDIREMRTLQKIWTGNKKGLIQVYNANDLNHVYEAARLNYGFSEKITTLQYTSGAVYAGSTNGWLKIYQPTLNPDRIGAIYLGHEGVMDVEIADKRMVACSGNGMVTLWDPTIEVLIEDIWED